jgi:hypothetical protein
MKKSISKVFRKRCKGWNQILFLNDETPIRNEGELEITKKKCRKEMTDTKWKAWRSSNFHTILDTSREEEIYWNNYTKRRNENIQILRWNWWGCDENKSEWQQRLCHPWVQSMAHRCKIDRKFWGLTIERCDSSEERCRKKSLLGRWRSSSRMRMELNHVK